MAQTERPAPGQALVTFTPAVTFTGYPHGKKVVFKAGATSAPVSDTYAALMREKGLVKASTQFIPSEKG